MNRLIILGATEADQVELDLFEGGEITLNASINKIGDITNRNSSYSNTFTIPRTSKNEGVMSFAGSVGNNSNIPYTTKRCRYLMDTTLIIQEGYLKLLETTADSYRVAIYDGIIDLDVLLGDSTIAELDYSENNHFLNSTSDLINTFTNTWADGYIYALGHFGKDYVTTNPSPLSIEELAPSVFCKYVFNKMFSSRGLSTTGFFNNANTDWEQLVLPPTKGIDISEVSLTETDKGTASSNTLNVSVLGGSTSTTLTPMVFATDSWTNITLSSGSLVVDSYTGLMEFNFTSTYSSASFYKPTLSIRMYKNEVLVRSVQIPTYPVSSPYAHAGQVLEVTSGDVIRMEIASGGVFNTSTYTFEPYSYQHTASLQINTLAGGTLIEVENYMSSTLKQKDFLKEILQRFGVVLVKNPTDNTSYDFVAMDSLLVDRANAVDWTDKVIEITKEDYDSKYAQSNDADYKYSEKDVVPFMNGSLLVTNENLEPSKTLFNSKFEIPITYSWSIGANPLYSLPIWEYNTDTLAFDNIEDKVRLMRVITDPDSNVVYFNAYGSSSVTNSSVALLSLVDMDYQYFFDTHYPKFKDMLDYYKEVEVVLSLSIIDYHDLDFTKLVYLKQTGRYYYLDSVKLNSKGAKATLIEIRNFNA